MWWEKIKNKTTRFDNLQVINFSEKYTSELGTLASRSMKLHVNIQDGDVMVSVDGLPLLLLSEPTRIRRISYAVFCL